MPIQYTNKKTEIYYLHQGATKFTEPKYFFSMKNTGMLVDNVPDGFEIYETPNAENVLRRLQPKIIFTNVKRQWSTGMKRFSTVQCITRSM